MTLEKIMYRFIILILVILGLNSCEEIVEQENNETVLKMLILSTDESILNKEDNTTISLKAIYKDGTSKILTQDITWVIEPNNAVNITNNRLLAHRDGNVTIQAKVGNVRSNKINIGITWTINGYKLPPEPDPSVNNSTLLGIDSNDNGVRDDVERKIIVKYVQPIEIELVLAYASVDQEILTSPLSDARILERKGSRVIDCRMYLKHQGVLVKNGVGDSEDFTYNTKSRAKKYIEYNKALSGGVYGGSPANYKTEACDFDVEQMLKDRK